MQSVGMADLLSEHFDIKESRVRRLSDQRQASSEVWRLLLDLDPYGGNDPLGKFPLFLQKTAFILTPESEFSVSAAGWSG